MNLNDLHSLKLAIDTGTPDYYNGRMEDALSELVEDAMSVQEALESVDSDAGVDSVAELVSLYNEALHPSAEPKEDANVNLMEVNFSTCKISGVELGSGRVKKFENSDSEHPIMVIIKESPQ